MKKRLIVFVLLTLGSLLDAAGFYFFLAPNQIAAGGINGLSLVLTTVFPYIPLGLIVLTFSLFLLIVGFILVGSAFGLKTVYCSIIIPLFIWGMEHFYPMSSPLTSDLLIQLFFGVLISSIGLTILFNQNASTGGTDIVATIFKKYYRIEMGKGLFIIDSFIVVVAGAAFGLEKAMYGLLGVILYGIIIDYIIEGINIKKHVSIITQHSEEAKTFILEELGRGSTIYTAKGGFTGQEHEIVVTVISRKEFIILRNYIKELDPEAFITVQNVHEVLGEGFSAFD